MRSAVEVKTVQVALQREWTVVGVLLLHATRVCACRAVHSKAVNPPPTSRRNASESTAFKFDKNRLSFHSDQVWHRPLLLRRKSQGASVANEARPRPLLRQVMTSFPMSVRCYRAG